MSKARTTDQSEELQNASLDLSQLRIDERLLFPDQSDRAMPTESGYVSVIGAGPAGLIAANILAQLGHRVTVFERLPTMGGMLTACIPVDRRPQGLIKQMADIARQPGIEVRLGTTIGRDLSFRHLQEHADAILLAVGAHRSVPLGIPGETMLDGVIPALQFLQQYHMSPQMRVGGEVAVIGGGWATIDAARLVKQAGAHSVRVFLPGTLEELPSRTEEWRAAQAEGIIFHPEEMPRSILGTEDANVHGLRCQKIRCESGRGAARYTFRYLPETNYWYLADVVLVALGERPDLSFVPEIEDLLVSRTASEQDGEENARMLVPGVFAAGDVVGASPDQRTVLRAFSGGYEAAHAIHCYLCTHPAGSENARRPSEMLATPGR